MPLLVTGSDLNGSIRAITSQSTEPLQWLRFSLAQDGAQRAIRSYRESQEFANLGEESYNTLNESNPSSQEPDQTSSKQLPSRSQGAGTVSSPAGGTPPVAHGSFQVSYTWPLPDGIDATVALSSRPTRRAISHLIGQLEAWKAVIGDPEPPPTDSLTIDGAAEDGLLADVRDTVGA